MLCWFCCTTEQFSHEKWKCQVLSRVQLFATPWTVGSTGFFREGYCSGLLIPSSGDLRDLGIEPGSPAGQADSLP